MNELNRKSIEEYKNAKKVPVVIVLDDIRSLHNVGSVFRTSDAFSIEKIVLCGITAKPPHREIQKTALGATESVTWEYSESCLEALSLLRDTQYHIYGVEQVSNSQDLSNLQLGPMKPIALVFGNEVKGVSQSVLNCCDDFIEIPQDGTKHSLNISVSVGIVLWEVLKLYR